MTVVKRCGIAEIRGIFRLWPSERGKIKYPKEILLAGVCAAAYHAGLRDADRSRVLERWSSGQIPVVAATIAFGMGIDRACEPSLPHLHPGPACHPQCFRVAVILYGALQCYPWGIVVNSKFSHIDVSAGLQHKNMRARLVCRRRCATGGSSEPAKDAGRTVSGVWARRQGRAAITLCPVLRRG